jgi:hypothetical protein
MAIVYDLNGNELWEARYNGPANAYDEASRIAVSHDGMVYVTGSSAGSGTGQDIATIKYNTAGGQQWVARYNSAGNANDFATGLALDACGNVYISGGGNRGENAEEYTTLKYDATGNQQWIAKYAGDVAYAITLDDQNNVYVTGRSIGNGTSYDYATIKYEQTPILTRVFTHSEQLSVDQGMTSAKLHAKAFPTAFTENINLQWSGSNKAVTITITDGMGRLVEKRTGLASSGIIQTGSRFAKGIYYASIVQGTEKVVLKLIKH